MDTAPVGGIKTNGKAR